MRHTFPTSPLFWAFIPVRTATFRACARGDPPPHGMVSSRLLAMAIDLVGGRSTSAVSPCLVLSNRYAGAWLTREHESHPPPVAGRAVISKDNELDTIQTSQTRTTVRERCERFQQWNHSTVHKNFSANGTTVLPYYHKLTQVSLAQRTRHQPHVTKRTVTSKILDPHTWNGIMQILSRDW